MLLPREQALRFIEGYKVVLLQLLSRSAIERTDAIIDDLADARRRAKEHLEELDAAFADLALQGRPVQRFPGPLQPTTKHAGPGPMR